jgi:hypothetical protein
MLALSPLERAALLACQLNPDDFVPIRVQVSIPMGESIQCFDMRSDDGSQECWMFVGAQVILPKAPFKKTSRILMPNGMIPALQGMFPILASRILFPKANLKEEDAAGVTLALPIPISIPAALAAGQDGEALETEILQALVARRLAAGTLGRPEAARLLGMTQGELDLAFPPVASEVQ